MAERSKKKPVTYDPNAPADSSAGIFGLPATFEDAKLVYLPVPWEATTSYGGGTALGPQAILEASPQMDVFDLDVKNPYLAGLHCLPISRSIATLNRESKRLAQPIKDAYGEIAKKPALIKKQKTVNQNSDKVNRFVFNETARILNANKIPGIIGGDHSVPFGAFQAAADSVGTFGILHFDAHSDTRKEYMGFTHSHASIMHNAATRIPSISKFVQVGIRDFCEEESQFTRSQGSRFEVFYDQNLYREKAQGTSFAQITDKIIRNLPENVWVSFDIDGLDPRFCPNTGTPVPGGLDFNEAIFIFRALAKSGRKIIGFDIVEVAPGKIGEWDANVGMRLLYKLSAFTLASQGICSWNS